eukprot:CAMPEP_0119364732 /NCGR_PEP_ID=MMETSP1334-20130426/11649_1 /TAXON_ID=127549 /ORGANISM="Calcidiscus leptoporus, Strain RCC1130" /LENGTH=94 /DNA_ID=CAMNT_0007380517 /DNA_START=55 /DNA_END=340 /DNA_ORIENTATION=-
MFRHVFAMLAIATLGCAAAFDAGGLKPPSFDKAELEALLRKEHSDRISNIYDSANSIQYTWNIEKQDFALALMVAVQKRSCSAGESSTWTIGTI